MQPESLSTPDTVGPARCVDLLLTPSDGYVTWTRNGENENPEFVWDHFDVKWDVICKIVILSFICAPRMTNESYSHSFRVVLPSKGTLYKHRAFHIANQPILT